MHRRGGELLSSRVRHGSPDGGGVPGGGPGASGGAGLTVLEVIIGGLPGVRRRPRRIRRLLLRFARRVPPMSRGTAPGLRHRVRLD